ncbi:kinase-like domain-containing protein, partial [Dichomitus squalens]
IVHSDIKPENFLIDGSGAVVLSDFGLAQRPEGASLMSEDDFLMWHGLPGGTAGYLAPEALNKVDPYVAHKSDLFSLG